MDVSAMASVHLRFRNLLPVNPNGRSLFHRRWAAKVQKNPRIQANMKTQVVSSRTQRIMEGISVSGEVGGAGGAYSYNALKRLDQVWSRICSDQEVPEAAQEIVRRVSGAFSRSDMGEKAIDTFDVLVCGGTLGVFIATALNLKGLRVGIVERNVLKGREQEWNISRKELMELVEVGVITEDDIEQATAMKFNPNRCAFEGKGEIWVEDILNLGVSPEKLIEIVKKRFISFGGVIFEGCNVSNISIYDDMTVMQLSDGNILSSQLTIDAMGNFSPVVKQIRRGRKPDGVCLVVGSCARGFKDNSTSDVIYSSSSLRKVGTSEVQLFWEAFPAGSGPVDRTTYMFTYIDPQPGSPKLEELLEEYWDLMPKYQGVSLDDLKILRIIYGIFPTYRDSPLPAAFDRVLQFGDASGIQSPVSFGGFGSLTRHLGRLSTGVAVRMFGDTLHRLEFKCLCDELDNGMGHEYDVLECSGIHEAVTGNFLDSDSLSLLNPYMPNLSSSWLFQRAMSAKQQSTISPYFINELLHVNFQSMQRLGDPVLRPFLQDVVQFVPLTQTLGLVMITKPQLLPSIFKQVGILVLLDWFGHFGMLGFYTFLSTFVDPIIRSFLSSLPPKTNFEWKRQLEAWKYGAGLDYKL